MIDGRSLRSLTTCRLIKVSPHYDYYHLVTDSLSQPLVEPVCSSVSIELSSTNLRVNVQALLLTAVMYTEVLALELDDSHVPERKQIVA